MPRYAVIGALDADSLPVGLVVEEDDCVRVEALDEYSLPQRISEPYRVLQRDLTEVIYAAGDAGYFDQVLVELSRLVAVGEQGAIEIPSEAALLSLFSEKVLGPRFKEATRGNYKGSQNHESIFKPRVVATPRQRGARECLDPSRTRLAFRVAA